MTAQDAIFWIALTALAFGFLLAVQMRVMTAHILRLVLKDIFGDEPELSNVVRAAAAGDQGSEQARHLIETCARPLSHLRLARRWSHILPVMIVCLLMVRRLTHGGVF